MSHQFTPSEHAMRRAIEVAREGISDGQTPFGACITLDGAIIAATHNCVWAETDITCHAEIAAIREACKKLGAVHVTGAVMYATCEPCPMCFTACNWADVAAIVYGAHIADAARLGFRELTIPNVTMQEIGGSRIAVIPDFLRDECLALFAAWQEKNGGRGVY